MTKEIPPAGSVPASYGELRDQLRDYGQLKTNITTYGDLRNDARKEKD